MKTLALLVVMASAAQAQSFEWEKDPAAAFARAKKERRPVLVLFGSMNWENGANAWALMRSDACKKAAKASCIVVKVELDKALPVGWPSFLTAPQPLTWGGIAVVTPGGQSGELKTDYELMGQKPDAIAAWIAEAADRQGPPWESSIFAAEMRAKLLGLPLLVMVGTEKEFSAPFRDAALRETLGRVVLLRVPGATKRYAVPGDPGVVLIDPDERSELTAWRGTKKAVEIKAQLAAPLAEWEQAAAERKQKREAAQPYVCAGCGYRSAEGESCCGDPMVKPEAPVWEKTVAAARERAKAEGRALIYVVMSDPKELSRVQELFGEARLAALTSRCILVGEEASEAGERPKEFGISIGVMILGGADLAVQAKLPGVPARQDLVREVGNALRRLRAAGSKK